MVRCRPEAGLKSHAGNRDGEAQGCEMQEVRVYRRGVVLILGSFRVGKGVIESQAT